MQPVARVRRLLAFALVGGTAFALQETKANERWSQPELEALARRIEGEVEELHGAKFVRPVAVRIATRADLLEFAQRYLELVYPRERMAADETIAKLLGMIPPEIDLRATTLQMCEEVGGYYDPLERSFSIMESAPKELAPRILAHELGHALDDQLYGPQDLLAARAENTDAVLAYSAVVEGSAMSLSNEWMRRHEDDPSASEDVNSPMPSVPMWLWKPFLADYLCGTAFVTRADSVLLGQTRAASTADVEQAFRSLPRSTEQVLHPEKYWDPARVDEPRAVAIPTENLPKGWSLAREDTLGELMLAILCTPPEERGTLDASNPSALLGLRFTNELAGGWGGDRVALLTNAEARYLVLVTQWDSERDAAEFYGALVLLRHTFELAARALAGSSKAGSGVEIAYGSTADEVVLTIHSAVEPRDLRKLEKALERKKR